MKIRVTTDSYEIDLNSREMQKLETNLEALLNMLHVQTFLMHKSRFDLQLEGLKEAAGGLHALSDLANLERGPDKPGSM